MKNYACGHGLLRSAVIRGQDGFWMIGLALAMAVIGVGLAGYIQVEQARQMHKDAVQTTEYMNSVASAIDNYIVRTGVLPCPAPMNVGPDSNSFGQETDCNVTTVPIGTCAGGICIQKSQRTEGMRVRIGAVPVRSLNLPIDMATDSWGNMILYAVTEPMAQSVAAGAAGGGISLIDGTGASVINPPNNAKYVLISSGPDGGGRLGCQTNGLDAENCFEPGQTTVSTPSIFRLATYQTVEGGNHFDDRVLYRTSEQPVQCDAGTVTWTLSGLTCSGTVPMTLHNATTTATNAVAGLGGSATFKCNAGTFEYVTGTCTSLMCPGKSVGWKTYCGGSLSSTSDGYTRNVNNVKSGYVGAASYKCSAGNWVYQSGTCDPEAASPSCSATTKSWKVGSANCSGPVASAAEGQTQTANNTLSGTSGSANFLCSGGSFSYVTGSCVQGGCPSGTKTWSNCSGVVGSGTDGQSTTTTNVTSGYSGTANFKCTSGAWAYQSGTCVADATPPAGCSSSSVSWPSAGQCAGTVPALSSGQSATVSNTNSAYELTSKATYLCSNGSLSLSSYTCTASTPSYCLVVRSNWIGASEEPVADWTLEVGESSPPAPVSTVNPYKYRLYCSAVGNAKCVYVKTGSSAGHETVVYDCAAK